MYDAYHGGSTTPGILLTYIMLPRQVTTHHYLLGTTKTNYPFHADDDNERERVFTFYLNRNCLPLEARVEMR